MAMLGSEGFVSMRARDADAVGMHAHAICGLLSLPRFSLSDAFGWWVWHGTFYNLQESRHVHWGATVLTCRSRPSLRPTVWRLAPCHPPRVIAPALAVVWRKCCLQHSQNSPSISCGECLGLNLLSWIS